MQLSTKYSKKGEFMSKNKYHLPFKEEFFIEFGGITKKDSHSWDISSQRYAYDFEIRENNLPYHDDYLEIENYYSYRKKIYAPLDGYVIDLCNDYKDTKIRKNRPIVCDVDDVKGNYILIKHIHFQVQDDFNFETAKGKKIHFTNLIIKRNGKRRWRKYVKNGDFVQNKNK